MGKEQLIRALRLIENDLSENYLSYDEAKLTQIMAQFQGKILTLRKKDQKIHDILQTLSASDLTSVVKETDLCLLSPPAQKAKLVPVLNSLILQEGKETHLLQMINKFNFLRKTYRKEVKSFKVAPDEYDDVRDEWLNHNSPDELTLEMAKMNLNDLRAIAEPWKIKSKSKDDFISLTINHIKKMKGLSYLVI